jgi:hypothetical protein
MNTVDPWIYIMLLIAAVACVPTVTANPVASAVAAVRASRAESNAAIAAHDQGRLRATFTDDYEGIQGTSGALDSGGAATAESYGEFEFKDATFVTYRRTPNRIQAAQSGKRVAESGRWQGIWNKPDGVMRKSGVYLARWVPQNGIWRLKSELFVTLACVGSSSCGDQD